MKPFNRARLKSLLAVGGAAVLLTILLAVPAYAAGDINTVIDSVRNWVAGLLAALATLFLTIGGARYLTANGNPRAVEEGKAAIKSALASVATRPASSRHDGSAHGASRTTLSPRSSSARARCSSSP